MRNKKFRCQHRNIFHFDIIVLFFPFFCMLGIHKVRQKTFDWILRGLIPKAILKCVCDKGFRSQHRNIFYFDIIVFMFFFFLFFACSIVIKTLFHHNSNSTKFHNFCHIYISTYQSCIYHAYVFNIGISVNLVAFLIWFSGQDHIQLSGMVSGIRC